MCNLRLPLQGTVFGSQRALLLADDDQFVAAKLFSGNGGMAWIQEGRIQAFRPAASFLVQFEAQTPLRSEAAFSQALELLQDWNLPQSPSWLQKGLRTR